MQVGFCDWCCEYQGNVGKMKKFLAESFYFLCKVEGEIIAEYEGFGEVGVIRGLIRAEKF